MNRHTPPPHVHSPECRCYYEGCVAWWRHWHGFLPGGCDDPEDPEGVPRIFDADDPEPGVVRDFNGAALPRMHEICPDIERVKTPHYHKIVGAGVKYVPGHAPSRSVR